MGGGNPIDLFPPLVTMLMHFFVQEGRGQAKGGGGAKKIRNRAAAVTEPQRHQAALDLVTLHSIIAHDAGKSFEINQLAYH